MAMTQGISKALFLDIDGVLNRAEYGKDLYEETYADYCLCLHRPSIEALKKLLADEPSLKVVWLTDWAKTSQSNFTSTHCYISPLDALEMFPWLKERVVGSVFNGLYTGANGDLKLLAVKSFIDKNLVESYAILDDDSYKTVTSTEEVAKHIVKVNPLKSFLLDDVPEVKHMLSIPMSKDRMHKLLSQMKDGSSFTINNRFSCWLNNGKDGTCEVFSSAKQDANCQRTSREASVLVYDKKTGEDLDGLVVLNYDKDLAFSHNVMLYVKHHGQSKWEFGTEAVAMSDMKAQM